MKKLILLIIILFLTIFNSSAQYTKLLDFNGTIGSKPWGDLLLDSTFLYGMTEYGGINDMGVIFKINKDGTGYTKLFDFAGAINGSHPQGSLISDAIYLYGLTYDGGILNNGTIFKIMKDGTGYEKLFEFPDGNLDGYNPSGSLVYDGTFLYGTNQNGGYIAGPSGNSGTIFKIKTDGTGYSILYNFIGGTSGKSPVGSLMYDGTFMYGVTWGDNYFLGYYGTIYKIKPDGTSYSKLFEFGNLADAYYPTGSLIYDGTYLYGMTGGGGIHDAGYSGGVGVLFKIKPDGTGYNKLMDFDVVTNGGGPMGSLISEGNFFYGMTNLAYGTVFKFHDSTNCIAHYTTSYDTLQNNFILNVDSITNALAATYYWDFGDGTTSTLAAPSHTYSIDTLYNVCMKIYTTSGDSCSYCHIIGKDTSGNVIRTGGFTINVHNVNTTGIFQNISNDTKIEIYPNPTNGVFNVQMNKSENVQINIYNVLGKCIHLQNTKFSNLQIDLSNQPNGIYFLQLKTENGIATKKIVINR